MTLTKSQMAERGIEVYGYIVECEGLGMYSYWIDDYKKDVKVRLRVANENHSCHNHCIVALSREES